jgi:hypothetical protein
MIDGGTVHRLQIHALWVFLSSLYLTARYCWLIITFDMELHLCERYYDPATGRCLGALHGSRVMAPLVPDWYQVRK